MSSFKCINETRHHFMYKHNISYIDEEFGLIDSEESAALFMLDFTNANETSGVTFGYIFPSQFTVYFVSKIFTIQFLQSFFIFCVEDVTP